MQTCLCDVCLIFYLQGLCFYLGREVPRQWIAFTILSCGGKVGWEGQGSPYCESSDSVTHQVVSISSNSASWLGFITYFTAAAGAAAAL